MSKPPCHMVTLSDTLSLCEYTDPKNGNYGFWLYDEMRGMNVAMRAESEREAFVAAMTYYQGRLKEVETGYSDIQSKVASFVSQFVENYDE